MRGQSCALAVLPVRWKHCPFFNNQEEAVSSKWSVEASCEMDAGSGPGSDCIEVSQAVRCKLDGMEYGTTRKLSL